MQVGIRLAVGVVLLLLGALWTLQGAGAIGGSAMSGKSQYLVLGLVVVAVGVALLLDGLRRRGTTRRR